jgi:hypothetical protein
MPNASSSGVSETLEPERAIGNGREFDIPAKRRCVVGDLIETESETHPEGKIEPNGGVGSLLVRDYLSLTTDNQRTVQVQSDI